jgi:sigma-B regulation protein RsbU (phosphoserine phosphatase)
MQDQFSGVMEMAGNLFGLFGWNLGFFAATQAFVYVFMQIVTNIAITRRVFFQTANFIDYTFFILFFGGLSIFGTLIGMPADYGAISNIRDLSPMIAGLVAGPVVGLAVGLIGGIHCFSLGGQTSLSCSLITVLAGLLAGLIFQINHKKLVGVVPAMLFAIGIELINAGLTLAIIRPFSAALLVILATILPMIIANVPGIGISIIVIQNAREIEAIKSRLSQF